MPTGIFLLDYWTNIAIEALWKEQVNDCKHINDTSYKQDSDIETGETTEWVIIKNTPFTDPFWGIIVKKEITQI